MKTFVVLGIRSGTSLVSSILRSWGVDMGTGFRKPDKFNEMGYFEDTEILKGVTDIIGNRFELMEPIGSVPIVKIEAFSDLLRGKRRDLWGFKAPGASFMIPILNAIIDDPHYILCTRDYRSMAQSLRRVPSHELPNGFLHEEWCKSLLWIMEHATLGKTRTAVDYDDIMERPRDTIEKLAKFVDIGLRGQDVDKACDLVKWELRHHVN